MGLALVSSLEKCGVRTKQREGSKIIKKEKPNTPKHVGPYLLADNFAYEDQKSFMLFLSRSHFHILYKRERDILP